MLKALERQLIYFPTRVAADRPTPTVPAASAVEEVWLDSDGTRIHGLYFDRPEAIATLLFLHGNAGNLYDRADNVAALVRAGFRVLIIDYRGYGKSRGRPSEEGLAADAAAAYRHLVERRGVPPGALVVFGRSLGSAVAIDLARREAVGALVVESGFTTARDLAELHYGWIPGTILGAMTHRLDSLGRVPDLRVPVLYVHGTEDRIVPPEMGRRLHAATAEPKEWYPIKGAGHNDTWLVGGESYYRTLTSFVRRHLGSDG